MLIIKLIVQIHNFRFKYAFHKAGTIKFNRIKQMNYFENELRDQTFINFQGKGKGKK